MKREGGRRANVGTAKKIGWGGVGGVGVAGDVAGRRAEWQQKLCVSAFRIN